MMTIYEVVCEDGSPLRILAESVEEKLRDPDEEMDPVTNDRLVIFTDDRGLTTCVTNPQSWDEA